MRALQVAVLAVLAFAGSASAATPQFRQAHTYNQFASGPVPTDAALRVGNLDDDGRADLIAAEDGGLWILRGTAAIGFPEPTLFGPPGMSSDAVTPGFADFTQDGLDDVLVFDETADEILLAPADGFGTSIGCACGAFPIGVVTDADDVLFGTGDLDLDGDMDFVMSDDDAETVQVFVGDGDYTNDPAPGTSLPVGQDIFDLLVANLDTTTARPEIAVLLADGTLEVYEDGGANLTYAGKILDTTGAGSGMHRIAAGDVTGDGVADLLASDLPAAGSLTVFPGGPAFGAGPAATSVAGVGPIAVGDVNADGRRDVVAGTTIDSTLVILEGSATGALTQLTTLDPGGPAPADVAIGDFDGDGRGDVVGAYNGTGFRLSLNRSPAVVPAPALGSFGDQAVGTLGAAQAVTITNTGAAPLKVTSIRSDSDDFIVSGESCVGASIASGGTCTARVRFGPSATGARGGTLTIAGNTAAPATAALTGNGTAAPGTGEQGPQGPQGARGPAGASGYTISRGHARCRVRAQRIQCVVYNAKNQPWRFRSLREGRIGNRKVEPGRYRLTVIHVSASGKRKVYRRFVRVR